MSVSVYPLQPYSLDLPLLIFGIGYEDHQPDTVRKEGFPLPQLFLCLSGGGALELGGQKYTIQKNSFFFLPPDVPHAYYGCAGELELYWIAFSGSSAAALLESLSFFQSPTGELKDMHQAEALCRQILALLKTENNGNKAAASCLLYELVVDIYRQTLMKKESLSEENVLFQNIVTYIDENYFQDLTLDQLAQQAGISPQYLCRLFRKHMNLRPFEYLTRKRIQQAKLLLSDPQISVAETAARTGFHDCSYFCSVFKRLEHISPSQFRGSR